MVSNSCFVQMLVFFCLCFALPKIAPPFSPMLTDPRWQLQFRQSALTACRTSKLFFYAAFNFILTRIRGEIFPGNMWEAVTLLAPTWLMKIICRNLCGAVLVTLALEKPWLQITLHRRPRAKVGGCVKASGAFFSSALHRLSFVRTDPYLSKCIHSHLPEQTGKIQCAMFYYPLDATTKITSFFVV